MAVGYVFFLVAWPVALLVQRTFDNGLGNLVDALGDDQVTGALKLTLIVAFWAVVINLVFGVTISMLLVRYEFPGKRTLSALIDLPLSVSPVVVGLALRARLQRPHRLVRSVARGERSPGHLQLARA